MAGVCGAIINTEFEVQRIAGSVVCQQLPFVHSFNERLLQ